MVGLGSEMSFARLLILILHIHECPAKNEREDGRDNGLINSAIFLKTLWTVSC